MYDAHYDLLTILYFKLKKDNKFYDFPGLVASLKKIYNSNNIKGGIVNLYFMSFDEMKEELDINQSECLDVAKMFEISINNLCDMKNIGAIDEKTDFLYSIEGCDYIKDEEELEQLYNLGLRFIAPVWNEKNKYGSGIREESGLTSLGESFVNKAIDLGIGIDVSHANEKTFDDILTVVLKAKEYGKSPILIASHSNVKSLCATKRNLSDEQLIKLRDAGGYIGLLVHGGFLTKDNESLGKDDRKPYFIKHLDYLLDTIGFSKDKIMVATDNMNFNPDPSYHDLEAFEIESVSFDLRKFLSGRYDEDFINKIMYANMRQLFNDVRSLEKGFLRQ